MTLNPQVTIKARLDWWARILEALPKSSGAAAALRAELNTNKKALGAMRESEKATRVVNTVRGPDGS